MVENETCGVCGKSIKTVATAHLRACFIDSSDSPSFAYVQDLENEQLICLDCCQTDSYSQPYPVKNDMDATIN
jgi:hypothetical protein